MNNYHITRTKNVVSMLSMFVLLSIPTTDAFANTEVKNTVNKITNSNKIINSNYTNKKIKHIRGVTVTGVNSVKGNPIFDWGEPFGIFNFPAIFAYNPQGAEPLNIDENTPDSAILATGVSPEYLLTRGETPDAVDPDWVNVPLRDVPINIDFDYVEEVPLKGLIDAQPLELSQSEPSAPITLGQWMQASGVLTLDCSSGNGARVKVRAKNLIPNRIYSIWATVNLPDDIEGEPGVYSATLPIGGTPNIVVTDESGNAKFERWIKFCPFGEESNDDPTPTYPMLNIELLYHADHEAYGAIPAPGIMLGLITFSHIVFPIDVEMLDD